jgi:hypothetical protein
MYERMVKYPGEFETQLENSLGRLSGAYISLLVYIEGFVFHVSIEVLHYRK